MKGKSECLIYVVNIGNIGTNNWAGVRLKLPII